MTDENTTVPPVDSAGLQPDGDQTVTDASAGASVADAPAPAPDEVLLNAVDLARAALVEITPAATIGPPAGHLVEGDGVLSLLFENTLPGYVGWFWTVSLSRDPESGEVNVLEAELMPGDAALLAPDWVPWADRLAEYQAQKKAEREAAAAAGEPEPEDEFMPDGDEGDEDDDEGEPEDDDELDADDELDELDDADDADDLEIEDLHDYDDDDAAEVDDFDEAVELQGAEEAALSPDEEE